MANSDRLLGGLVLKEAGHKEADLFGQKLEGAVVQDDKIGQLTFAGQGQLLGESLAGERGRDSALLQPP